MDVLEFPIFKDHHPLYCTFKITERMERSAVLMKKKDNLLSLVSVDMIAEAIESGKNTFSDLSADNKLLVISSNDKVLASILMEADTSDDAQNIIDAHLQKNNAPFLLVPSLDWKHGIFSRLTRKPIHQWPLEDFHYDGNLKEIRHAETYLQVYPSGLFSNINEKTSVQIGTRSEKIQIATLISQRESFAAIGYDTPRYCHCNSENCYEAYPVNNCQKQCGQPCKRSGCKGSMSCTI